MATYTAVIGDTSSIGQRWQNSIPSIVTAPEHVRRNPQLASARIRTIMNPHIVSSAVGGLISADFTIPAEEALRYKPLLRYGVVVWLFDGNTPIFQGWAEQPVWTITGDCQMTLSGPWILLGRARMREAWELWDMTLLNPGTVAAERLDGTINLGNNGALRLAFSNGSALASPDRISVEYLLFGETSGSYDGKLITAFEFDISDNAFNGAANIRFRVIGCTSPGVAGTQLYDTNAAGSSGKQGALNLNGTNQGAITWGSTTGYRCLRFQLVATGVVAATGPNSYVTLDRIRIGTREALFPVAGASLDTAAVARDVLAVNSPSGQAASDTPQEFWYSRYEAPGITITGTDSNSFVYGYGLDPQTLTGTAANSGVGVTGFTALEWQSPADILANLAAMDGRQVGFYLPYNARGGYDAPGSARDSDVGSYWLSAPPQLTYQAFPDPNYAPDYTIHTREGAQIEPNVDAQPLIDRLYVNYQNLRGRQLSVVTTDTDARNYANAQGFGRADDYSIQPSVGDSTLAAAIGQQTLSTRRQPSAAATITIENDGASRYPILKAGAAIPRLATIRPGSVRIVDVAASSGLRAGYATDIEWWGQTLTTNERVTLTLAQPGQVSQQRAQGKLANRIHRERRRLL